MLRVYQTWRYSAARLPIRRIPIRAQQATSVSMSSKQMKSEHEGHLLQVRSAAAAYTVTAVATRLRLRPCCLYSRAAWVFRVQTSQPAVTTVTHLLVPPAARLMHWNPLFCQQSSSAAAACMGNHPLSEQHVLQVLRGSSCRLQVSKDFDGVLTSRSIKELDSILDSNVTLHKGAPHLLPQPPFDFSKHV